MVIPNTGYRTPTINRFQTPVPALHRPLAPVRLRDSTSPGTPELSSAMQDAINKAAALVEAHEYIRRFEGKAVVVKVGGSIMDDPQTLNSLIMDVCFMDAVGMRPVIVHGGGKSITEAMKSAGLEAQFVQGHRYTDERTLAIAEHVLVNEINSQIVAEIKRLEHKGMGLHTLGSGVIFGKRLFLELPAGRKRGARRKIDIGFVGEVGFGQRRAADRRCWRRTTSR